MLKKHPPAYERKFTRMTDESCPISEKKESENEIRVMTWNILARSLCKADDFWVAPKEAGSWLDYRLWRTLDETIRFYSDVICLQEIDAYEDIKPYLHSIGFVI